MKINFKHYILILFALGSVILAVAGYWFVYNNVIKQAENYSSSLQNISIENQKKQHISEVAQAYRDTIEDRNRLTDYVLTEDKIVGLIEMIESIGQNSASTVSISTINNEDLSSATPRTFGHLKAHIDASGSWTNVMRALIMIENLPYSISLDNLSLSFAGMDVASSKNKGSKTDQWKLSFDISVLTIK